ncbi:HlyD family secretion protein [Desulfosoma caldarium]|uniref:Membrane fusion protein (Multidrug efflux system) n=1 Tax=Desulfosoma caldarium TaxID=610254 RepID=A0A3N1USZ6_9BACT|nr:HlyD family secretion protein [Desulfosoma caldarium]ROQ90236.1 membrane fusion protein (multidrug efflux system) [Desulfosoma caldarium]
MGEHTAQTTPEPAPVKTRQNNKLIVKRAFAGAVLAALIVGTLYWWIFLRNKETTDNAYVMADVAAVSSRIPGTVAAVHVDNDHSVAQGQVLIELDTADEQARLREVEAALGRVQADIHAARATVDYMEASTQAAVNAALSSWNAAQAQVQAIQEKVLESSQEHQAVLAEYRHAKRDWERFDALAAQGASSVRDRDRMKTALSKAQAAVGASEARLRSAEAALEAARKEAAAAEARLQEAQAGRLRVRVEQERLKALLAHAKELEARRDAARLNLSYCRIVAPIAGYVAQKKVQVGERVLPGQPLLAVVPLQDAYVEANFKETQVENIRIGQPVHIRADCYPGRRFSGTVEGIRAGTGAAFSLFPPENATGNWIKITQRVPVKIRLTDSFSPEYPLRLGFSLKVTVDTSDRSGPRLRGGAHRASR